MKAPGMSEAALEAAVLDLAGMTGWLRAHFRPAMLPGGGWATHMSGDTGFPDLVLARPGRLAIVELKDSRGKPSTEQVRWLDFLETVAAEEVDVCLWRPADWLSGAVAAYLKGEGPAPGKGAWRAVGRRGGTKGRLPGTRTCFGLRVSNELAVVEARRGELVRRRVMG